MKKLRYLRKSICRLWSSWKFPCRKLVTFASWTWRRTSGLSSVYSYREEVTVMCRIKRVRLLRLHCVKIRCIRPLITRVLLVLLYSTTAGVPSIGDIDWWAVQLSRSGQQLHSSTLPDSDKSDNFFPQWLFIWECLFLNVLYVDTVVGHMTVNQNIGFIFHDSLLLCLIKIDRWTSYFVQSIQVYKLSINCKYVLLTRFKLKSENIWYRSAWMKKHWLNFMEKTVITMLLTT